MRGDTAAVVGDRWRDYVRSTGLDRGEVLDTSAARRMMGHHGAQSPWGDVLRAAERYNDVARQAVRSIERTLEEPSLLMHELEDIQEKVATAGAEHFSAVHRAAGNPDEARAYHATPGLYTRVKALQSDSVVRALGLGD